MVRVEPATGTGTASLHADLRFTIEHAPDFGLNMTGQIRLSKANGQEILVAPLENTNYIIKCNPDPRRPYSATELIFTLRPQMIHTELEEGEPVYADVVIRGEDGTEYGVGRLETRITHLPVTYFP